MKYEHYHFISTSLNFHIPLPRVQRNIVLLDDEYDGEGLDKANFLLQMDGVSENVKFEIKCFNHKAVFPFEITCNHLYIAHCRTKEIADQFIKLYYETELLFV